MPNLAHRLHFSGLPSLNTSTPSQSASTGIFFCRWETIPWLTSGKSGHDAIAGRVSRLWLCLSVRRQRPIGSCRRSVNVTAAENLARIAPKKEVGFFLPSFLVSVLRVVSQMLSAPSVFICLVFFAALFLSSIPLR